VSIPKAGIATAVVATAATAAIVFVLVTPADAERSKSAEQSAAQVPCQETLLDDWADGRIDRDYPIGCYRATLKSLPTDLKVYSSAPDDIARALSQRIVQSAGKRKTVQALTR
jgi:hypothetical protein